MDFLDPGIVKYYIETVKCPFEQLSNLLKVQFPGQKGLSVRNLQRFCSVHNIKRNNDMTEDQIDHVVKTAVENGVSFYSYF